MKWNVKLKCFDVCCLHIVWWFDMKVIELILPFHFRSSRWYDPFVRVFNPASARSAYYITCMLFHKKRYKRDILPEASFSQHFVPVDGQWTSNTLNIALYYYSHSIRRDGLIGNKTDISLGGTFFTGYIWHTSNSWLHFNLCILKKILHLLHQCFRNKTQCKRCLVHVVFRICILHRGSEFIISK